MGVVIKFRGFGDIARYYPFWGLLLSYRRRILIGLGALALVDIVNVSLPLAVRLGVDAIPAKNVNRLFLASGCVLVLMLVQSLLRYLWRIYLIGTSHSIAKDLRQRLYAHLQTLPLPYYQRVHTGDLMSRATNDIEAIREAVGPGLLIAADAILVFLFVIPVMFWLSPKLTLLAFAFFPIVPWLTIKVGNRIDVLFDSTQNKMSRLSTFVQQSFSSIRLVKSLVLEHNNHNKFIGLSDSYRKESIHLAKYEAFFSPALSWITYAGTFLILLFGGWDVMAGAITIGTFVAFQRFVVQVSWPMEAIGWAVTMNREGLAAYRRFNEILDINPVDKTLPSSQPELKTDALLYIPKLSFSYNEEADFQLVLEALSIQPGEKVGLVGPIGAGKTTLFKLLTRLYEPEEASVYFGGKDVRTIPLPSLRNSIAGVEQQIQLFSESIAENIRMGMETKTHIPIELAAQNALIDEEIAQLDGGYSTLLGEKGVNVSGGQKQRLALSRALIRRPRLLILDDAFSAVDVEVESKIIHNLFSEYQSESFLVASHRLSIMPKLDKVWVMDKGRVVSTGTHVELIRTSPLYAKLWDTRETETAQTERRVEL